MATFKPVQAQTFYLAGSGATIGDTTIVLASFKQIDGTTTLLTANFGSKGYATIEPNNSTQEEQISFTTVTQNVNGTATLSGVKTVLFITPYTETSGLEKSHPGGSKFIISNTSKFYDDLLSFDNDETVTGLFTFNQLPRSAATPSNDADLATKVYIDSGILAGAANMGLTTNGIGEEATAAEINAGTQAGSTLAELIINPKYLKDSNYYLFLPTTGQKDALAGSSGTPSTTNKYITEDDVSAAAASGKIVRATGTALPALAATNLTSLPVANLLVASQEQGDVIYASSASAWAKLAHGTDAGMVLRTGGHGANPSWGNGQLIYSGTISDNNSVATSDAGTNTDTVITHSLGVLPSLIILNCDIFAAGQTKGYQAIGQVAYKGDGNIAWSNVWGSTSAGTSARVTTMGTTPVMLTSLVATATGGNYEIITVSIISITSTQFTFRINGNWSGAAFATSSVNTISYTVIG